MRGQPDMYVRIDALAHAGLEPEQVIRATVLALTELGAAEALVLIHGKERGMARYWEAGGAIRFTSWGDPYVPVFTREKKVAGRRRWWVMENVTHSVMRTGRGSVLGPDTSRRARWWDLLLECGHRVERRVSYKPLAGGNEDRGQRLSEDARPAPKRIRCDECTMAVVKAGAAYRREYEHSLS